MESLIYKLFFDNWQRKLLALISAVVIWLFVNQQITDSKTIRNVPIRIVNLPADKTIIGLLPNGILHKKVSLTLTGTKDVIDDLEQGDLEVLIDASTIDHHDWIAQITKKNLVSLNPSIDLANNVTELEHTEFVLKLNRLVTVKVPITILAPTGEAPPGYEFLDIWPQKLMQTISGPEEELQKLRVKGLEISFDLDNISKADLDILKVQHDDEISFMVPNKWKQVVIPYRNNIVEEINDADAQGLRIDFLRKGTISIEKEIPLQIFFPLKNSEKLNPETLSLAIADSVAIKNGLTILNVPLYAKDVSRLFIEIIKDRLGLVVTAAPLDEREILQWSFEAFNSGELEDTYVATMISNFTNAKGLHNLMAKKREALLRKRFKDYLQRLSLWTSSEHKLNLEAKIEGDKIKLISY